MPKKANLEDLEEFRNRPGEMTMTNNFLLIISYLYRGNSKSCMFKTTT